MAAGSSSGARGWRLLGLFWIGVLVVVGAGAVVLSRLGPVPQPVVAALPVPAAVYHGNNNAWPGPPPRTGLTAPPPALAAPAAVYQGHNNAWPAPPPAPPAPSGPTGD